MEASKGKAMQVLVDKVLFSCRCVGKTGDPNCPKHPEAKVVARKRHSTKSEYLITCKSNKNGFFAALSRVKRDEHGFPVEIERDPLTEWVKLEGKFIGNMPSRLYRAIKDLRLMDNKQLHSLTQRLTCVINDSPFLVDKI